MLDYTKSFIETQFPVSKISKESYKERKANLGQTLTGLGKWWGRKPLILVRATILGTLMPISEDPVKDREIFLKILTMDEEGLWLRKNKNISTKDIFSRLNKQEISKYFDSSSTDDKPKYLRGIKKEEKDYLQRLIFNRLSYDEKLVYCERPENVILVDTSSWDEINNHLETDAYSIQELVKQLGVKRFGHSPKIGDCFAGGGSIPFEAARMGADVYASDLNPIASLLTWASLYIAGASDEEVNKLKDFQQKVYDSVDKKILELGIETDENGNRADSYLYCNEVKCPECGYKVPLAPSWVIGKGTKTVALLKDNGLNGFDIDIVMNASKVQFIEAEKSVTVRNYNVICPHCHMETPIPSIRGDYDDGIQREFRYNTPNKLRIWDKSDFINSSDDIYTERLYAIRYIDSETGSRFYKKPSFRDLENEEKVNQILAENIRRWQEEELVPSVIIEKGWNTNQLTYEKGWQFWHQVFNPRQILILHLFLESIMNNAYTDKEYVLGILGVNKIADWNSKLCIWNTGAGTEKSQNTFTTQSLNTLFNYGTRALNMCNPSWFMNINNFNISFTGEVNVEDARNIRKSNDVWITDPPYADAVNYHELTEFFLAWDKPLINKVFPDWYTDSKRILAVKGTGESFNKSMIDIYKNIKSNMPDNGYQVVMFTHQDVKVWSELAMILWSAGLHVVSAWNISTETESGGLKDGGNYVSGTVLLTLKKQTSSEIAFQDELYDEIKYEVKSIIDSMRDLDDKDDPDFTDADYLLASYAASLKVLTAYKEIEGIDVHYWLSQPRDSKEENPVEALIKKAVRIAYDYLIPEGFEKSHWTDLKPEERFFIRGLELEMNGVYKISSYQELARGFGVSDYKDMFASFKANSTRLKTPSEFKMAFLNNDGFGSTLVRHLLVAINETTKAQSTIEGRNYLRNAINEGNDYWYKKPLMSEILSFISKLEYVNHMEHWKEHAYYAKLLREALKNEGV